MKRTDTERHGPARRALRWLVKLVVLGVLLVLAGLFAWALEARDLPELEAWHRAAPASEFRADRAGPEFTFADYRALEERIFAGLSEWDIPEARFPHYMKQSRYRPGGPGDPAGFDPDWNRSTELVPEEIRGGALLIHGLSDSPYSMRTVAELLHAKGLYVLCLRLPGHGTVPAGLLDVAWEDWAAAVEVAARHVVSRVAGAGPFYVGGYSCGGALATRLAALAVQDPTLAVPDHVFLFSPAIGITGFARTSNWHKLFSWMAWLEKSKWLGIEPEYDPFKYNSFPKNAGAQMWLLTQATQACLQELEDEGRVDELPPFLAFQSAVDATIVAKDVVEQLFARLPDNGSELVVMDVNCRILHAGLYAQDPRPAIAQLESGPVNAYRFTTITNREPESIAVVARSRPAGSSTLSTTALGLTWPPGVYSLSHLAIPVPPDDPLYGYLEQADTDGGPGLPLGRLALRGEKDVLRIPASQLLRLRANPFHSYLLERIEETIAAASK
jgi:alpha-beta hydrolase superfamily lysophospholipase